MTYPTIILPRGSENWIFGALARDLQKLHRGRVLYFPSRKKHLITRIKYMLYKPRGTVIILHQEIFIQLVQSNKNILNCDIVVFYTHQNSHEDHELQKLKHLKEATKIIVCSLEIKQFLIKIIGASFESRIKVVVGGADVSRFKSIDLNRETSNVIFVSRLTGRKRPDLVLRTVKENPEYFFFLHGKNWLGSIFLDELLMLPNFKYMEFNFQKANEIYNKCSVFMSLSDIEGAPMPALEALAAGCKVILTNTGFAQELINISKSVVIIPVSPSSEEVKFSLGAIQKLPYPDVNISENFSYTNFLNEFTVM
jgi:glycosyltransferase involved in cell wall biosynthesis